MARFIVRRLLGMLLTMFLVSIAIFLISEVAPGDISRHILGAFATQESVELYRTQLGLEEPMHWRYIHWLAGSDWRASRSVGYPLEQTVDPVSGIVTWWADVDGTLTRWKMKNGEMTIHRMGPDGKIAKIEGEFDGWQTDEDGDEFFWGIDTGNRAALWNRGFVEEEVAAAAAGRAAVEQTGGVRYIPIQKGLLRGDPGVSVRTGRPVAETLFLRLRNSLLLAGIAFIVVIHTTCTCRKTSPCTIGCNLRDCLAVSVVCNLQILRHPPLVTNLYSAINIAVYVGNRTGYGDIYCHTAYDFKILLFVGCDIGSGHCHRVLV